MILSLSITQLVQKLTQSSWLREDQVIALKETVESENEKNMITSILSVRYGQKKKKWKINVQYAHT